MLVLLLGSTEVVGLTTSGSFGSESYLLIVSSY